MLRGATATMATPSGQSGLALTGLGILLVAGAIAAWGLLPRPQGEALRQRLPEKQGPSGPRLPGPAPVVEAPSGPVALSAPSRAVLPDADRFERAERIERAGVILDRAWRDRPFEAAGLLCVKGWTYMAMLGHREGRERLVKVVGELSDLAQNANWHMQVYLGDASAQEYLLGLASDRKSSFARQLGAFEAAVCALPGDAAELPFSTPLAVEAHYRDAFVCSGYDLTTLRLLAGCATERSRPLLEDIVWASAFDSRGGRKGAARAGFAGGGHVDRLRVGTGDLSACHAQVAIGGLERLGGSASRELLRSVSLHGTQTWLRLAALRALAASGDLAYALETARDHLAGNLAAVDRVRLAGFLVEHGDEGSRGVIHDALDDRDRAVRATAYAQLCALGDRTFIATAALDREPGDEVPVGFHAILSADSERSGFHPQATPGYMSPVCLEYLLAIAQSTTMPEVLDLVLQAALSADNESLRPFASRAEDVLDARPVVLPQTRTRDPRLTKAWSRQVKRLVFLLCAGDANTRARAMERLEMMYDATPQLRRTEFILDLRWCMNRRAIPLLARAVEDAPGEAERLIAATSLLAVEAGVVPE